MSPSQKKRFMVVAAILGGVALTTFFALMAMRSSFEYFRTPSQINAGEFDTKQYYRIAGLVKKGSVNRLADGVTQRFTITDCEHDVVVQYTGILPDLFREGQAIVSVGKFNALEHAARAPEPSSSSGLFLRANQVLAKHDENYIPNEAADAAMLAQANKCDSVEGTADF